MRLVKIWLLVAGAVWSSAVGAGAQSTNGTITGRVSDPQGLSAPGVTVIAESPNLQGTRATVTSAAGDYILTLLPPGAYTVSFTLPGFTRVEKTASLAPTQVLPIDATLGDPSAEEVVEVSGRSASVLTRTTQVATSVDQTLLATLPTNRDIFSSLNLANVHATGPLGAPSIGGAPSFANHVMVNGVSITDNLRGQPYKLYIEDAVEQTTVATAGISAEYGRFSGGVVNIVTKSGGNRFSGLARDTLVNDKWRTLTPFERTTIANDPARRDTRIDRTVPTHEYTLGGPVMKDRLWFFVAGRNQTQESERTLVSTNVPYTFELGQRRYEAKVTYAVTANHRLQGSFIDSYEEQVNQGQATAMDVNSLYDSKRPMNLFTIEYNAILSPRLFLEVRLGPERNAEGRRRPVEGPRRGYVADDRAQRRYWAATFCGVCGAEERDGQDVFVKGSYFLSSPRTGSHTMTFGYDGYNDRRYANNHQSGSDYRITGTNSIVRGTDITAQFLADGQTLITWQPIFVTTEGTSFRTHSGFYSDSLRISDRITANLGVRYDRNHAVDSSGQLVANNDAWSPRLGIVVDPWGDQKWALTASASKYVEALANTVANAASSAGNPDTYQFAYRGPDINRDTTGPLTPTADGIRQVFEWFEANGGAALPVTFANVAGLTSTIGDSFESPSVWEYSAGISRQVGARAVLRADVTYRDFDNFYANRTDTGTGRVVDTRTQAPDTVRGRAYNRSVIENTDVLTRRYAGLSFQGRYRIGTGLDTGATYTLSRAWGNVEGETANGPSVSATLQYPEYKQESWSYPVGDLPIDQRHRARIWAIYALPWLTGLTISGLQTLESGVPYGAVSPTGVNVLPFVNNPGYLTPPAPNATTYYFTARDAYRTEGQRRTDMAVGYAHNLRALPGIQWARHLQLFGQLQVLNVFNSFQLCGCGAMTVFQDGGSVNAARLDQTVLTPVTTAAYQAFDPITSTPVEGVNWAKGPNFGQALSRFAYTTPRTLRLTFGVRF